MIYSLGRLYTHYLMFYTEFELLRYFQIKKKNNVYIMDFEL